MKNTLFFVYFDFMATHFFLNSSDKVERQFLWLNKTKDYKTKDCVFFSLQVSSMNKNDWMKLRFNSVELRFVDVITMKHVFIINLEASSRQ